jgi:hypothetical protein
MLKHLSLPVTGYDKFPLWRFVGFLDESMEDYNSSIYQGTVKSATDTFFRSCPNLKKAVTH